jgi:hypothetical protein
MLDYFEILIPFLLIHIICDFYLQPNKWVEEKKQKTYRAPALYYHSLLHGAAIFIPAFALGINGYSIACLIAIVAVSHFFIDLWKVSTPNGHKFSYFVIDQTLHISVIALISYHMADGLTVETILKHDKFSDAVLVAFAYLLILKPTSIMIGNILKKYPISEPEDGSNNNGLVAGGELIGYLERILILTFTLVGSYADVGFVLAAKSIFRFGELNKSNDRSMTEYVLIGSLVSVVITTLLGTIISLGLEIKIK